MVRCSAVLMWS